MLHCGCKICCKYCFMLTSCWPHDDSLEGPRIGLSNCCLFSLCFLMFSSIMLISVLPLFCLSFLISLCSLLSSSTLLLFPFFAVIFSTFIPHPHCRMLSFLSIILFQYSTCPEFCFTRTCLLRHRNWSCSVAFLKMWTSDCYRLRKPLTLSVPFHVPLNGVFRSAYNHMQWAMCALTLYPKQPKSSKPKFLLPFPLYMPLPLWNQPLIGWRIQKPIAIFGLECFSLHCKNTTMVSIIADSHNK